MKAVYCDESGFTGNNLLSEEQPHFVYSSVAIESANAEKIIAQVIKSFRLQMSEIKGSKLTKSQRGKDAALWIMGSCSNSASVVVVEKQFALAGKFYEYMFESVLAPHSTLFYQLNFHRFISNALYVHFVARDEITTRLLHTFEQSLIEKDFDRIEKLLESLKRSRKAPPFIRRIATFCLGNKQDIITEWNTLRDYQELGKWILDLTLTALHSLLASWGKQGEQVEVYCDDSKPLLRQASFFDSFINYSERVYIDFAGKNLPVTYNLAKSVQMVNSKDHPGIQIADVFASSIAYALKNRGDDFSEQCVELCKDVFHENSMGPDLDYADLDSRSGFTNLQILEILAERTRRHQDLFYNLPLRIVEIRSLYPLWAKRAQNH
jgi:hypothetical protein